MNGKTSNPPIRSRRQKLKLVRKEEPVAHVLSLVTSRPQWSVFRTRWWYASDTINPRDNDDSSPTHKNYKERFLWDPGSDYSDTKGKTVQ